jgi:hypothetical protein
MDGLTGNEQVDDRRRLGLGHMGPALEREGAAEGDSGASVYDPMPLSSNLMVSLSMLGGIGRLEQRPAGRTRSAAMEPKKGAQVLPV